MKIAKGHYVPKELITSEAVHEAVVKCFVAAGFVKRDEYGQMPCPGCFSALGVNDFSQGICWTNSGTPITLQQLFTAENGICWPDWAVDIRHDLGVIFTNGTGTYAPIGNPSNTVCGYSVISKAAILATRQPKEQEVKAIKDAVIAMNGKWSVDSGDADHLRIEQNMLFSEKPGDKQYICTIKEFESASKRLGYINGYRWGVEYPTNGKRPELPDDVLVQARCKGYPNFGNDFKVGNMVDIEFESLSTHPVSFKITDPRYKPVDKSYLNGVSESSENNPADSARKIIQNAGRNLVTQFMQDNLDMEKAKRKFIDKCLSVFDEHKSFSADGFAAALFNAGADFKERSLTHSEEGLTHSDWHERGELPPVGAICEYTLGNSEIWYKCEIRHVVESDGVVMFAPHLNHEQYCSIHGSSGVKFRPIRTERDQFIDDAEAAFRSTGFDKLTDWGFLYDAGFRGPKVEK